MNIIFFGSGEFGLPTLQRLVAEHRLVAVVSQPDRPAGRGGLLTPTPISQWTSHHLPGIPLLKPEKVGDPAVLNSLRSLALANQAVFVVIAFGQKMPTSLLEGIFALNLHASLLPRWRGAAPINAAILAGDTTTGNSVITLADRMDAGLILGQSTRVITPDLTAGELHDTLSRDGPDLVLTVLRQHELGSLHGCPQDEALVTKAAKLSKKDSIIDFSCSAEHCRRKVHGLTPWPGVTVSLADVQLKLLRVAVLPSISQAASALPPGSLIDTHAGVVQCGDHTLLRLIDVQPAGKRAMSWDAFARGRSLPGHASLRSIS